MLILDRRKMHINAHRKVRLKTRKIKKYKSETTKFENEKTGKPIKGTYFFSSKKY